MAGLSTWSYFYLLHARSRGEFGSFLGKYLEAFRNGEQMIARATF